MPNDMTQQEQENAARFIQPGKIFTVVEACPIPITHSETNEAAVALGLSIVDENGNQQDIACIIDQQLHRAGLIQGLHAAFAAANKQKKKTTQ